MSESSIGVNRVVIMTPAAQSEVRKLLQEPDKAGMGLRLGIKGGGCSGLSYVLDFTPLEELTGRGFVFSNPMASNTCGCGESFSL